MKNWPKRSPRLTEETRYPWDGAIKITVHPDAPLDCALRLRVPGWAHDEAVPSDLYRFTAPQKSAATLQVNGERTPISLEKGYAVVARHWSDGDVVKLKLPMEIRRVAANQKS